MQLEDLNVEYDKLQKKYGAKELDSIYNGGCKDNPNIWDLFYALDLLDEKIYTKIKIIKGIEWTEEFASEVYSDVEKHKYFITNLGKCTQIDARELPDKVYKEYLHLLEKDTKDYSFVCSLVGNYIPTLIIYVKI